MDLVKLHSFVVQIDGPVTIYVRLRYTHEELVANMRLLLHRFLREARLV